MVFQINVVHEQKPNVESPPLRQLRSLPTACIAHWCQLVLAQPKKIDKELLMIRIWGNDLVQSYRNAKSKSLRFAPCLSALLVLSSTHVDASENGIDGFSTNPDANSGASCLACHTQGRNQSASVQITGPARVSANSINEYVVTLTGGPAITAGVDIAVYKSDGNLHAVLDDLRTSNRDLTHSRPKPFNNGQAQFRFRWKAPSYNASTEIYVGSNSSNGQRDLIDDAIASARLPVQVYDGSGSRPINPQPPVSLIKLETVASGLGQSISIANAGDQRMFVVDKSGKIRLVLPNGQVAPRLFLDISSRVESTGGEQGLLGLAFDPDYATNGFFYVHYTRRAATGSTFRGRVSRFRVSADPQIADDGSEKVLLETQRNTVTHNGGDIRFGKDGYLYIASGDGGEPAQVQNPKSLLGKILRIDVNGTPDNSNRPDCGYSPATTYRIPRGNAYRNGAGGGCDEIYALGLRNPWRLSLDRNTGDLWIGDVGQESFEEINFIKAGAGGGANLGWPCLEGTEIFDSSACVGEYLEPIHAYDRTVGRAVVGGFVYRGNDIPSLRGRYLFSDYGDSSNIYSLVPGPDGWVVHTVLTNSGKSLLSSFGEDGAGELYALSAASSELYRVVDGQPGGPAAKFHLSSVNVSENQPHATISVQLTRALQSESQVSIATQRESATPGVDFYGQYKTLRIPAGARSAELQVQIINDTVVESDETVGVRIFHPVGAVIGTEKATILIADDDAPGALPVINVSSHRANESDDIVNVLITLSSAATETVTFAYSTTTAGSATSGVDFYGSGGQVTIAPGQRVHRIPIQLVDDDATEATEYFYLRLVNVRNAVEGVLTGRIDLIDND